MFSNEEEGNRKTMNKNWIDSNVFSLSDEKKTFNYKFCFVFQHFIIMIKLSSELKKAKESESFIPGHKFSYDTWF